MVEVTAAIILRNNHVLMTRRSQDQRLGGFWEFPGGKVEGGESLEECLVREIKEELNLKVSIDQKSFESIHHYDSGSIKLISFKCSIMSGTIKLSVHDQYQWIPISEVTSCKLAPADLPIAQKLMEEYL
jgi:8-oxo-dGTP diphosphatase